MAAPDRQADGQGLARGRGGCLGGDQGSVLKEACYILMYM